MRPRLRWPSLRLRRWRVAKNMATCVIIFIYLVNIVLRTSVVLSYYCETDCNLKLWARPLPPEDDLIISYICHKVLDPPQTDVAQPLTTQDLDNPSWRLIGHWHLIQQVIRSVLGMFPNGVFVEVGAGDGAFLSHTAWLEKEMNWTGLLIEPRPWSYQTLRKRRKAMGARVCVSDVAFNHKVIKNLIK
ncbi:hypothetical protein SK128_012673 [Halocaridina rubra]|uniref:Uncharacterized protein n=1 Tax=Halocaridina rubra TaxID=373956 RepID=A0AAN8WXZ3_HALRR